MKKTILFICTLFIALSSYCQALTGNSQDEVKKMTSLFNTIGTQKTQITNVWFDKSIILNMADLLNSEIRNGSRTDGIRIYFAYSGIKQTVVIVSTRDSYIANPRSIELDNFHVDYYDHPSTAALFNMQIPISGEPCYGTDCNEVALLYGTNNGLDTCQYSANNPHYLSKSECADMVHAFVKQQTKINTRGEWFDLKILNAFADLIKSKSSIDGIRIYFGRHTANDAVYPDYLDKDAFVIVPTQTVPGSNPVIKRQDFFDCTLATYKPELLQLKFRKKKVKIKGNKFKLITGKFNLQIRANNNGNGGGQDTGELCPDNCNL